MQRLCQCLHIGWHHFLDTAFVEQSFLQEQDSQTIGEMFRLQHTRLAHCNTTNVLLSQLKPGFPLSFDIEIQGLSRTLKFHFQGPILDGSLQHEK